MKFRRVVLVLCLLAGTVCSAGTNEVAQCWSQTQSGTRCKRRAVSGERYCKQHSASRAPKKTPEKCRSFTADGTPDDLHYELEPMLGIGNEMETCVR